MPVQTHTLRALRSHFFASLLLPLSAACADTAVDLDDAQHDDAAVTQAHDSELPPEGDAALRTWLAAGLYTSWACEPAPHEARGRGAHGRNRICSNALLADATDTPWPVGAAAVKELYDDTDVKIGFAVYRKMSVGSTGASWYWYEALGDDVIADGRGSSGAPKTVCTSCHRAADDFVFTQVRRADFEDDAE